MPPRLSLSLFVFALWCLSSIALTAARPNVILVMTDDQGWGDTGYNGHPYLQTPHLDRMSAEGVTFTRFYSAAAMCSPTRASVYTGRHPYRTGVTFAMDNTDLTLIVCELKMNTGSAYHFPGAEIDVPPQVRVGRLLSQIPPPRFVFSHKADTFFYSS